MITADRMKYPGMFEITNGRSLETCGLKMCILIQTDQE